MPILGSASLGRSGRFGGFQKDGLDEKLVHVLEAQGHCGYEPCLQRGYVPERVERQGNICDAFVGVRAWVIGFMVSS